MHTRHKRRGQMIPRGNRKWLIRVFVGSDAEGRKKYASKTVEGTNAQAQQVQRLHRTRGWESVVPKMGESFELE